MNNLSYAQMGHISHEGLYLDQRIPTEKFKYDMGRIDWLDSKIKNDLIDLVSSNVELYGNLNPYALAIGFLAVGINDEGRYEINEKSLKNANKILSTKKNYEGDKLKELIEISDVIRYARMYIKLKNNISEKGTSMIVSSYEKNDNYEDVYDEEYHDQYENIDYGQYEEEYY